MFGLFQRKSKEDKLFEVTLKKLIGKAPKNLTIYSVALRHASITTEESNERLEFLGDAILGSIVGEYLFNKYPFKDEGFLTEIRSRLVKRESLTNLALQIGLNELVVSSINKNNSNYKSIYGNALEALIGAIYIDHGYKFTYDFVISRMIIPHINLDEVVQKNHNFKSILIEWAQKNNERIRFNIVKEEGENHKKTFTSEVILNQEQVGLGKGASKKKAEQAAAKDACNKLEIIDSPPPTT